MNQFYVDQSAITNPGKYRHYFDALPDDIAVLCEVVRGLFFHFLDTEMYHHIIPPGRLIELETRYVDQMLEKLLTLHDAPLYHERHYEKRLVASCRDYAVLLCAILRHKKIPARLRFGFSVFHIPGYHHDLAMLEYWNEERNRWCLVDPRMNDVMRRRYKLSDVYNAHDVPRDHFYSAAQGWQLCRRGDKRISQFGSGLLTRLTGWWFLRSKLGLDFAALNKIELLPWDVLAQDPLDKSNALLEQTDEIQVLDTLADLLSASDVSVETLRGLYLQESALRVPQTIYSNSFASGGGYVTLRSDVA